MKKRTLWRDILFFAITLIAFILPLSPVFAVGVDVRQPLQYSTENIYYGKATNDLSVGNLMLLQNYDESNKFRIDRTGKVYAAGPYCDINGNNCLTSGGGTSQWITTSSNIYNSNSGSVGIGTAVPLSKLDVRGSVFSYGENYGFLIDSQISPRVGLMKYPGKEGGIWRTNNQDFEIGRVDSSSLLTAPSAWTTDLYVSGSGNVGIGTDSPGTKLAIYNSDNSESVRLLAAGSSGSIQGKSSIGFAQFTSAANPSSKIEFREAGTATYNGEIGFFTNNTGSDSAPTEKVTINADGNLGIGITNPTNKLHVYYASNGFAKIDTGTGQVSGVLLAEAGSNKWAIANRASDSNNLYFSASPSGTTGGNIASAAKMTITQSGNVGIGTTAPGAKLEVIDSSYSLKLGSSLMGSAGPSLLGNNTTHLGTLTNSLVLYGGSAINFNIGSTPSTKMKIDSAGRVGIGTTAPAYPLDVAGNARISGAIYPEGGVSSINGVVLKQKIYSGTTGDYSNGFGCVNISANPLTGLSNIHSIVSITGVIYDSLGDPIPPNDSENSTSCRGWNVYYENGHGRQCGSGGPYIVIYPILIASDCNELAGRRYNIIVTYF